MDMVITVATITIMATITLGLTVIVMQDNDLASRSNSSARGDRAKQILEEIFVDAGWQVMPAPSQHNARRPDLVVRRRGASYAIEVKAASEGRSDRLIALWSQAHLQAARAALDKHPPLAVVAAPRVGPRVAENVLKFAAENAPDAAAGVIDFVGLRRFRGPHLEELNSADVHVPSRFHSLQNEPSDLFSDLNQWMLKVLLAPELPEHLLSGPRDRYRNASHLARMAGVSPMSASRLVRLLAREGYLAESDRYLRLVRREDLFRRWQASSSRRIREMPMRFLLRGDPKEDLRRVLLSDGVCLALFAAADALRVGFVRGVPPHLYVARLHPASLPEWKNVVAADPSDVPDFILRQAPARQSVFRGMVRVDGKPVSDVLQIWLDVSSNPARGEEQAELIRHKVLDRIIRGAAADE
jgi:hypothetical protein